MREEDLVRRTIGQAEDRDRFVVGCIRSASHLLSTAIASTGSRKLVSNEPGGYQTATGPVGCDSDLISFQDLVSARDRPDKVEA